MARCASPFLPQRDLWIVLIGAGPEFGPFLQVALRLAQILARSKHSVTSVIRDPSHSDDIIAQDASPKVLSLEDDSPAAFTSLIEANKADVVYFTAGSGGKGGDERTKKVDYEGAVKIFDAIEAVRKKKPLVLLSGVEVRDFDRKKIPSYLVRHYA